MRWQGLAFCGTALAVAAGSAMWGRAGASAELWAVAGLVALFGVPHGALDSLFAQRLGLERTALRRAGFWAGYAGLAAGVVAVWAWAPAAFLGGFLLLSALHFAGDPAPGTPALTRALQGGGVVVLPALLHAAEIEDLFALLAGPEAAGVVAPALAWLAGPWLLCCAGAAAHLARTDWLGAAELMCVAVLAAWAPPLVGFAVFFCGMHSARHVLRTARWAGAPLGAVLRGAAAPMAVVAAGAALAWAGLRNVPLDARLVQVLFVGLAALTVPHMLVVERAGVRKAAQG